MKNKIFWGLAFIFLAVLIIFNSFNGVYFHFEISVVRLFLAAVCIIWTVKLIVKRHIPFVFFPIGFMFMLLEKYIAKLLDLNENIISNWLVLLCALLLCVGTGFISSGFSFHNINIVSGNGKNRLTSLIKYIDCTDFSSEMVEVNMGRGEVFFENIDSYTGGGTLDVDNNMSWLTINVPHSWKVICNIESNMGRTDMHVNNDGNGKILNINGENNMGRIIIKSV